MKKYLYILFFVAIIYNSIVITYQRLLNPKLTETELLLLIPDNWKLKFKHE